MNRILLVDLGEREVKERQKLRARTKARISNSVLAVAVLISGIVLIKYLSQTGNGSLKSRPRGKKSRPLVR